MNHLTPPIEKIINEEILLPFNGTMGQTDNFNSYGSLGIWKNGGTNVGPNTNAPNSADNGYLIVFQLTGTSCRQIWIGLYQGIISTRFYNGSTWSAWRTL